MHFRHLVFIFTLLTGPAFGQELITGIVADSASFKPLPYVTILIKNTDEGTYTDSLGNFSIRASAEDTLVFSFVGYKTVAIPLWDWEPGVVLMAERTTVLKPITIHDRYTPFNYELLFEEQHLQWKQANSKLPFYYHRQKKDKILAKRLENENLRVSTYMEVVVKNPEVKNRLMKEHHLTEEAYYSILRKFNEQHHRFMYYLSAPELINLLERFFELNAPDVSERK